MQQPNVKPYTVLRPICTQGKRADVGDTVYLTRVEYSELATAGKVGPLDERAKKPGKKAPAAPAAPAEPQTQQGQQPASDGGAGPQVNEANP